MKIVLNNLSLYNKIVNNKIRNIYVSLNRRYLIYQMNKNEELITVLAKHPDIYKSLIALFNNHEDSCLNWLNKRRKPLCDMKPIDLLNSDPEKVSDIIYRIETGDFS